MPEQKTLKLVILYEAGRNVYSVSEHNQTPEQAEQLVEEYNQHLKPGFSLIAIDQKKPHKGNAESCRACRHAVKQSSDLQPSPTFSNVGQNRRRKSRPLPQPEVDDASESPRIS